MNNKLHTLSFDPELTPGARNAVEVCLRIQPHERVIIITDIASQEIAASIAMEMVHRNIQYRAWILEDVAPRPLQTMPLAILEDLATSHVSIFAVAAQPDELRSRMQITEVVTRHKIRHAHMVNINKQIMMQGMRADFHKVDAISTRVCELARSAKQIRATTSAGTEVVAELNPNFRWIKTSGIINPEKWGNLPGGEVFTAPERVEGTFVIDGVIGDYLGTRYGNLRNQPLTIQIKDSRVREIFSQNKQLEDDFWKYTHTDENSDRVGELAIGTNIELREIIGNILQDEKIPGVHLAFGNPYGEHTGAQWFSSTHLDVVGTRFDIWVDDRQIMRKGEFVLDGRG